MIVMQPMMFSLALAVGGYKFETRSDGFVTITGGSKEYSIDPENMTCSCPAFFFNGYKEKNYRCKHLQFYQEAKS